MIGLPCPAKSSGQPTWLVLESPNDARSGLNASGRHALGCVVAGQVKERPPLDRRKSARGFSPPPMDSLASVRQPLPRAAHAAALPRGVQHPMDGRLEPPVVIGDDQLHASQAARGYRMQEVCTGGLGLRGADGHARALAETAPGDPVSQVFGEDDDPAVAAAQRATEGPSCFQKDRFLEPISARVAIRFVCSGSRETRIHDARAPGSRRRLTSPA